MAYSPLAVWLTAQVTFTELIHATATLETACRRHGWNGVLFGAGIAVLDFVFFGICLLGLSRNAPRGNLPTITILLLLFAGAYLANKSYILFNAERNSPAPQPFVPRIRALPITRAAFARGFWSLIADCGGILAVWVAISITLGWQSATLGAVLGIGAIIFLMLQTEQIGLTKTTKPSSFYGFAAGVVTGYAVYFFKLNNISHH